MNVAKPAFALMICLAQQCFLNALLNKNYSNNLTGITIVKIASAKANPATANSKPFMLTLRRVSHTAAKNRITAKGARIVPAVNRPSPAKS